MRGSRFAANLVAGFALSLSACVQPFQNIPADGAFTVTWSPNKETMVNMSGGGYRVYFSQDPNFTTSRAPYVDVDFNGDSITNPEVTIQNLVPGVYYVRVAAYGLSPTGRVYGELSTVKSFNVESAAKSAQKMRRYLATEATTEAITKTVPIRSKSSSKRLSLIAGTSEQTSSSGRMPRSDYKSGEILIRYKTKVSRETSLRTARVMGGFKADQVRFASAAVTPVYRIQLAEGTSVDEALAAARLDSAIELAQPNYIYRTLAVPNDAEFGSLWGLRNSGQTVASPGVSDALSSNNPGSPGKDINATSAWDLKTDCSSVIVAVIDSGVRYTHDDIAANMWSSATYPNGGYDFVEEDKSPIDYNGHGTHVAGVIGAVGDNGIGVAGLCWTAKIMAVRVLDVEGSGTTASVVAGINFAVAQGAKIINLSLGGGAIDSLLAEAIKNASDAGVIVVTAAGNSGTNNDENASPVYPCNFDYLNNICVAALDQNYSLASYSNYGMNNVHVGAPGTNISSLWAGTVSAFSETFATGWSLSGWARRVGLFTSAVLTSPTTWDGSTVTYANSADYRAYKSFTLPTGDFASLELVVDHALSTLGTGDFLKVGAMTGTGDPFATTFTLLHTYQGSAQSQDSAYPYVTRDVTQQCVSQTCTIGLQLTSDASGVSTGAVVRSMNLYLLSTDDTSLNMISGTSMAAPHVAGVAALIWAMNPSYTSEEVLTALKSSGQSTSSLLSTTITGKAIDAYRGVIYFAAPRNVTLSP